MSKRKATPHLKPRAVNIETAALYLGVSTTKFMEMRSTGTFPVPQLPYGNFYDLNAIDHWLDEIGGLQAATIKDQQVSSAYHENAWLKAASNG